MYTQTIMSSPRREFKEIYLTKKGQRLIVALGLTKEEKEDIYKKYSKNRYSINLTSKPVKQIKHA